MTVFSVRDTLGRRYACDFTVVSIGPGDLVRVLMRNEMYELSTAELETLIARGFVIEVPRGRTS